MIKEFINKLKLMFNKIQFTFPIRRINGKVKLSIHEKHRKTIKYIKYILAALGIASSIFNFLNIFQALLVAIIMFLIGCLIEKIGYRFYTLYITPIQQNISNLDSWIGAGFGYLTVPDESIHIPVISWIFSRIETAKEIHSLLMLWSHNELDDLDKNINISVIIDEKEGGYYFILTPNLERKPMDYFNKKVEKEAKLEKETFDDRHEQIIVMQIVQKKFDFSERSYLLTFRSRLTVGTPVILKFTHAESYAGEGKDIPDLNDVIIHSLVIKDRHTLTRKDVEYDLFRI